VNDGLAQGSVRVSRAERRRQAVARLLRTRQIATQEDLLAALRAEGFDATQATLSRDLARLGARRVPSPEGPRYELGEEGRPDGLDGLARLVAAVECNGALIVVRTESGSAPAIARAIDLARLPGVLGTIAGDDTIFIAPSRERSARAVAGRIRALFEQGRGGPRA
jgi:transcriptional regulator of arginine metabolism